MEAISSRPQCVKNKHWVATIWYNGRADIGMLQCGTAVWSRKCLGGGHGGVQYMPVMSHDEHLKSPATPTFAQQLIQANKKENIQASYNWSFAGESTCG